MEQLPLLTRTLPQSLWYHTYYYKGWTTYMALQGWDSLWLLEGQRWRHIHTYNHITTLVNNSKLIYEQTKETLKIMLLWHTIKYHKARYWIRQEKSTRIYICIPPLLLHIVKVLMWNLPESQEKGHTQFTTITTASATASSIHQDAFSTKINCNRCGNTCSRNKCPPYKKECYNCSSTGYFTSLCIKPHKPRRHGTWGWSHTNQDRYQMSTSRSNSWCQNSKSGGRDK